MTRRIAAHKGGRTAHPPGARIRPQTLQRIRATMREREASFADLLEEQYSGGNDMAGYDVLYCGKCGAELPEVKTVYRGGPRDDEREVERLACKHQGDGGVTFKYFDWDGKKYVAA